MNIDLTHDELILISRALAAVAPSGGGSPQFHLSCKIAGLIPDNNEQPDYKAIGRLQLIATREVLEGLGVIE